MAEKDFNKLINLINNVRFELAKNTAVDYELNDDGDDDVDYILCFNSKKVLSRIYFTACYLEFIDESYDDDIKKDKKGCMLSIEPDQITENHWMLNFNSYHTGQHLANLDTNFCFELSQAITKLLDFLNSDFPFLVSCSNNEENKD